MDNKKIFGALAAIVLASTVTASGNLNAGTAYANVKNRDYVKTKLQKTSKDKKGIEYYYTMGDFFKTAPAQNYDDFKTAAGYYKKVLEIKNNELRAISALSNIYNILGRKDEAAKMAEKAGSLVKSNPDSLDYSSCADLAAFYDETRDYEEAVNLLNIGIKNVYRKISKDKLAYLCRIRGGDFYLLGKLPEALKDFEWIAGNFPDDLNSADMAREIKEKMSEKTSGKKN